MADRYQDRPFPVADDHDHDRGANPNAPARSESDPLAELARQRNQPALRTIKHFHEELRKRHNYTLGYTVTRLPAWNFEFESGRKRLLEQLGEPGRGAFAAEQVIVASTAVRRSCGVPVEAS